MLASAATTSCILVSSLMDSEVVGEGDGGSGDTARMVFGARGMGDYAPDDVVRFRFESVFCWQGGSIAVLGPCLTTGSCGVIVGVGFNLISVRISLTRHRSEANSSFNALFSTMRYWHKSASTGRSSLTRGAGPVGAASVHGLDSFDLTSGWRWQATQNWPCSIPVVEHITSFVTLMRRGPVEFLVPRVRLRCRTHPLTRGRKTFFTIVRNGPIGALNAGLGKSGRWSRWLSKCVMLLHMCLTS